MWTQSDGGNELQQIIEDLDREVGVELLDCNRMFQRERTVIVLPFSSVLLLSLFLLIHFIINNDIVRNRPSLL